MEIVVTLAKSIEEAVEIPYIKVGCFRQFLQPGEKFRSADGKSLVGTEGRKDSSCEIRLRDRPVITQVVGRIVSSTDDFHMEFLQDALRCQVASQSRIGAFPNGWGGDFIEQVRDAEIALEFEMGPVIERIAQGIRNGARPRQKFLVRTGIAGNVFFWNAVGAHRAP